MTPCIHRHAWNMVVHACNRRHSKERSAAVDSCMAGWPCLLTATTSRTTRKPASWTLFGSPSAFSLDDPDFRPGNTVGHRIRYQQPAVSRQSFRVLHHYSNNTLYLLSSLDTGQVFFVTLSLLRGRCRSSRVAAAQQAPHYYYYCCCCYYYCYYCYY